MPNKSSTSPVVEPTVVTWRPTYIVTDGPPVLSNPNPGPHGNVAGPLPHAQPNGPGWRAITPAPGTLYGDVTQATMVQRTMGVMEPYYPPPKQTVEFPVYYPGVGWVSSDNAPKQGK